MIECHNNSDKIATITAIQPGGRFGSLEIDENHTIHHFKEKSLDSGGWINGGFMVLNSNIIDYIEGDTTIFEKQPLENVARDGQLNAYKHYGFWQLIVEFY